MIIVNPAVDCQRKSLKVSREGRKRNAGHTKFGGATVVDASYCGCFSWGTRCRSIEHALKVVTIYVMVLAPHLILDGMNDCRLQLFRKVIVAAFPEAHAVVGP